MNLFNNNLGIFSDMGLNKNAKTRRSITSIGNILDVFFSDTFITFVSGELHDLQIARGYISNFDNIHFCFCQTAREKSPTDYAVNR
jgi:hypothetical protein